MLRTLEEWRGRSIHIRRVASRVAHCRRRRQAASGSKRSKGREKQAAFALHSKRKRAWFIFASTYGLHKMCRHNWRASVTCAQIRIGSEMDALDAICPCSGTRRRTKCHKIGGSGEPSRCRGGRWRWAMGTGWWALASIIGGGEPILVKMCKR